MRLTGTVYVTDHQAKVTIQRHNLVVSQPAGRRRIPIETVEGVVLTGRAEITNHAIGELVRRRIRISALSKRGHLRFAVGGPAAGNVHLRLAQYAKATDTAKTAEIARWLVAGKLQNCRRMMRRWTWDTNRTALREAIRDEVAAIETRITALPTAATGDTIRGIEGDGSRRYFKCMAAHLGAGDHLTMRRRSRRPPRDPLNAALSFTYGLVLAEVVGALDAVGLDPQIGYLHQPRPGRPSLALDLLEELRPAVADRFCVAAVRRNQIRPEDFVQVSEAHYLSDSGRTKLLGLYEQYRSEEIDHPLLGRKIGRWALPTTQATLMARYLRGDLPRYPPYLLSGVKWTC